MDYTVLVPTNHQYAGVVLPHAGIKFAISACCLLGVYAGETQKLVSQHTQKAGREGLIRDGQCYLLHILRIPMMKVSALLRACLKTDQETHTTCVCILVTI